MPPHFPLEILGQAAWMPSRCHRKISLILGGKWCSTEMLYHLPFHWWYSIQGSTTVFACVNTARSLHSKYRVFGLYLLIKPSSRSNALGKVGGNISNVSYYPSLITPWPYLSCTLETTVTSIISWQDAHIRHIRPIFVSFSVQSWSPEGQWPKFGSS